MAALYPPELELSERASTAQGVCLNVTSRRMLSEALDPEDPKDWKKLAELMSFDYQAIRNIDRERSPTQFLLDEWKTKSGSTLGQLIHFLSDMERYDLLENEAFFKSLERDAEKHVRRQEEIVQVPEVGSSDSPPISMDTSDLSLTLGGEAFHAFVSYAEEDFWFVRELLDRLEPPESNGGFGLKICIDVRNLLAGSDYEDVAQVIRQKCRRILLIISPNFLRSPACDFHVKYSHALAPGYRSHKIVPIVIPSPTAEELNLPDNVELQQVLLPLKVMDFTKEIFREFFWEQLGQSLGTPLPNDENGSGENKQISKSSSQSSINSYDKSKKVTTKPSCFSESGIVDVCIVHSNGETENGQDNSWDFCSDLKRGSSDSRIVDISVVHSTSSVPLSAQTTHLRSSNSEGDMRSVGATLCDCSNHDDRIVDITICPNDRSVNTSPQHSEVSTTSVEFESGTPELSGGLDQVDRNDDHISSCESLSGYGVLADESEPKSLTKRLKSLLERIKRKGDTN